MENIEISILWGKRISILDIFVQHFRDFSDFQICFKNFEIFRFVANKIEIFQILFSKFLDFQIFSIFQIFQIFVPPPKEICTNQG